MLPARVARAFLSYRKPRPLEPVDQPRGRVLRQEHAPLELERAQASPRRAGELEEGVVPGKRWESGPLELRLDRVEQRAADADEAGPSLDGGFRGVCVHAGSLLIECNCIKLDTAR